MREEEKSLEFSSWDEYDAYIEYEMKKLYDNLLK